MANVGELSVQIGLDHSDLEKGVGKAQSIVSGFVGKIGGAAAGLSGPFVAAAAVAVTAIAGIGTAIGAVTKIAIDTATEIDSATGTIATGLGISKEEASKFDGVMKNIYKAGYGDNFDDIASGVVEVNRQIGNLPDAELQALTQGVFGLRDAFGVDLSEGVNAVDVLMEEFGLSSTQALDFVTAGFQKGLNSSGDFIDTITEYSNLFGEAQVPADAFFSILESGLQGGVLGTDKVADLFKEFGIRIMDGSDTTRDALAGIGIDYDTLQQQIASGSITAFDAFGIVQEGIAGLKTPLDQNTVGVGLFGTQWEDMGASAVLAIDDSMRKMDEIAGASATLGEQYNTLPDIWEQIKRKAEVSLAPIGKILLDGLKENMPRIEAMFAWFETTAIPWITEFVSKATPILTKFFDNFEKNFGPGLQRLADGFLSISEALGITGPGVSGMDALLQGLEKTLNFVVAVFDIWTNLQRAQMGIISGVISAFRTVAEAISKIYEAVRNVLSVGGNFAGSLFSAGSAILGFSQGGQFVVPPGFPNDSFPIGVSSGELVSVTPAGQVNSNNKSFTYAPTYHGVSSSNPEMDYYTMNSLAG